jgi:hypothetical protein
MHRNAKSIRVAIAGVGNCACALIQGLSYYSRHPDRPGLINKDIGGYSAANVEVVLAFDVDSRKVGKLVNEAIFCAPNCVEVFEPDLRESDVVVQMAPLWTVWPPYTIVLCRGKPTTRKHPAGRHSAGTTRCESRRFGLPVAGRH